MKWRKFVVSFVLVLGFGLIGTSSAYAGNLWLTGHDADFHCRFDSQCNHFGIALDFVRLAAPDPTRPLLFLSAQDNDLVAAEGQPTARLRNTVQGAGNAFPFVLVDPTSLGFASLSLSTDDFSAIVIASDDTCGGCDLNSFSATVHSDAINARTADIQAFFNAGGGLAYFAGADNRAVYYASVPIPAAAVAVAPPFTLTAAGVAIGLLDPLDTDCCFTHNSFNLPGAGSPLVVLELDSADLAETMIVRSGTIVDDELVAGPDGDAVIPEPSSMMLLGLGMFGAGARKKFKLFS